MRLGVDVGGTFTDVVAVTGAGHVRDKVPSDPGDPAGAVIAACELVAVHLDLSLDELLSRLTRFGLGTTVVTNMLATHTGRRLGLLTTAGFEDLIPLARGNRVSDGGWLVPPPQLVDRACIIGVAERMDRDGAVTTPVDVDGAVRAARDLVEAEGVEALVVSFLWSFRNPAHEEAVGAAVAAKYPDLPIVLGSELSPVIREYERTQYALLNAYVAGALDWLAPLAERLRARGLTVPVVLTHSSGGATTVDGARSTPIGLAQSGPAAGAAAATRLARAMGETQVVTCDLGGTSLDVALISGGEALRRTRGAVLGHWTSLSMVDVDSVGSGGGSIAWVDAVGAIRVGPRSAGAAPGPACYGRGGTDATLTDALVVLGYLDPDHFLGGRMPLDAGRATEACGRVGNEVGLDPVETAWGIREVAQAAMARAVRNRVASRGLVAADLALLAYGGCGGLFAGDIAREVGARVAVVPHLAPVLCAFGAATAPLHRERARSVALRLPAAPGTLEPTLDELRAAVLDDLAADGVDPDASTVQLEADVRFERQGAELGIPIACGPDGRPRLDHLHDEFR
ncbi:MAG TPA: hydantoinase/oxoprolinase family protein, partial [Acidimicrobiia bacterium]|nr:hydantoinase/oxoprolinase family protein [Acidimicrobiia bacterium]